MRISNLERVNLVRVDFYNSMVNKSPIKDRKSATDELRENLEALNIHGLDCSGKAQEILQDAMYMIHGSEPPSAINYAIPNNKRRQDEKE